MTVPIKFRKSRERIISFNFNDIQDGTGIVKFFGFNSNEGGTKDYHLTTESTLRSRDAETEGNLTSSSTSLDLDFDLTPFNLPKIIAGKFTCTGAYGATGTATASDYATTVKIRKWDGSTETDLVSVTGEETSGDPSAGFPNERFVITGTIPRTHFKKGETLRVTITGGAPTTNGNYRFVLGHDPKNNDGTRITPSTNDDTTTILIIDIPFDLDL